jgi:hypothetical protein
LLHGSNTLLHSSNEMVLASRLGQKGWAGFGSEKRRFGPTGWRQARNRARRHDKRPPHDLRLVAFSLIPG